MLDKLCNWGLKLVGFLVMNAANNIRATIFKKHTHRIPRYSAKSAKVCILGFLEKNVSSISINYLDMLCDNLGLLAILWEDLLKTLDPSSDLPSSLD